MIACQPLKHGLGERVLIDNDPSLSPIIIGIQIFERGNQYQLAWFESSGSYVEKWFDEWRLSPGDAK